MSLASWGSVAMPKLAVSLTLKPSPGQKGKFFEGPAHLPHQGQGLGLALAWQEHDVFVAAVAHQGILRPQRPMDHPCHLPQHLAPL